MTTATDEIPFYERAVESFADADMVELYRGTHGLWYATLAYWRRYAGEADFARCGGRDPATAVRLCAAAVRAGLDRFDAYDLHFRLMQRWAENERRPTRYGVQDDWGRWLGSRTRWAASLAGRAFYSTPRTAEAAAARRLGAAYPFRVVPEPFVADAGGE
jgi:hypothetical protein